MDRVLSKVCPSLSVSMMQKCMRFKQIKVNGKAVKPDARLSAGDEVKLFIADEYFVAPKQVDALLSKFRPHITVVYEDEQILLVDKKPGIMVHPDEKEKVNTLVTHVRAYLYQKGTYDSQEKGAFAPTPVNRIDRFTGGIVIFAKTKQAMDALNKKIRDHEVDKLYVLIACGRMRRAEGTIDNYIVKGEKHVSVSRNNVPGGQRAVTHYQVLTQREGLSLVQCRLVTGRTHQIRAQFADMGNPLLGDQQYGNRDLNRRYGREQQVLYACGITFAFESDAGVLAYLSGKTFRVRNVPFVEEYFQGHLI